jgi:hypothetical protein
MTAVRHFLEWTVNGKPAGDVGLRLGDCKAITDDSSLGLIDGIAEAVDYIADHDERELRIGDVAKEIEDEVLQRIAAGELRGELTYGSHVVGWNVRDEE